MKGKRFVRILGASSLVAITITTILAMWTAGAETYAHYRPEYKQIDLLPMLQKDELTEEEYSILFRQTGLARAGIDELRAGGRQEELLYLQQRYFADLEIECLHNNLFIRSERLVKDRGVEASPLIDMPVGAALSVRGPEPCFSLPLSNLEPIANTILSAREQRRNAAFSVNGPELVTAFLAGRPEPSAITPACASDSCVPFPTVQPGDILITYSGHVFGWRSGHAAIVIDAEKRLTLEAITMGCDSRICSLADWEEYPSVALLRLKGASFQERERIAAYAEEHLKGLPYSLAAFTVFDDGTDEAPSGTIAVSLFSGALGQAVRCGIFSGTTGAKMQKTGYGMFSDSIERSISYGIDQEAIGDAVGPGTQCAHLVWYAYRNFGYDLDSDGGFVVTPDDLYHSDLLELVQIYGIPPNY
ncbi:MAG: hypothetical protein HFH92_14885 [Lachnospiraceae bacterium]|uniref:hypothetical protein n=1 Tax=uncultured Acetatifactor sp. TaxID=1671927 RepID=UPI0026219CFA|nr:hypothetical protein [uncultured Acetatifactor sp.]MCI8790350.1 hypothetical protein [Lachnospiraceae bacterium]